MIKEGVINIGSESAKELGFTRDRFFPYSYLWRTGNMITISFIMAKQKGMFCQLIKSILEHGFDFEIPIPSRRMREIGEKQNWILCQKPDEVFGMIDILTNKKSAG